jgi:hypothetical protein
MINKLELPNITAVCLQGRNLEWATQPIEMRRIRRSLTYMVKYFNFHEIIFISTYDPQVEGITFIHTEPVSYYNYNRWCIRELTNYVTTDYCLSFQDDGFPLHPELWDEEFLKYDYVGAPLPIDSNILHHPDERIGGGGLTLRSKKFLDFTATWTDYEGLKNEDTHICYVMRNEIYKNGMSICPHTITRKFVIQNAIDDDHTIDKCFGFHGRDQKLITVDRIFDERL